MKEKYKNIIKDAIDIAGYCGTAGFVATLVNILRKILKYGEISVGEPNPFVLYSEIGLGVASIGFLGYKLVNGIRNRYKL